MFKAFFTAIAAAYFAFVGALHGPQVATTTPTEASVSVSVQSEATTTATPTTTPAQDTRKEIDDLKKQVSDLKSQQTSQPKVIERIIEKTVPAVTIPKTETSTKAAADVSVDASAKTNAQIERQKLIDAYKAYVTGLGKIEDYSQQGNNYYAQGTHYLNNTDALAISVFDDSIKAFNNAIDQNSALSIPEVPFKSLLVQFKQLHASYFDASKQVSQAYKQLAQLNFDYPSSAFSDKLSLADQAVVLGNKKKDLAAQLSAQIAQIKTAETAFYNSQP